MRKTELLLLMALAALLFSLSARPLRAQEPVQFKTTDGVTIYANYYPAKGSPQPMILLFHQAHSNRYEYSSIAPHLEALGFSCLATDQRFGGTMFGEDNETDAHMSKAAAQSHSVAGFEADLEAALAWAHARDPQRKVILWGSSYSASLVFVIAAKHPAEVAGVLAFSPGEYFPNDPTMIEDAAKKVYVPVFITSENSADAVANATKIFDAVASSHKVHYSAKYAVHGSSTLLQDRNPKGAAVTWQVVMKFLTQFEE
ncbi:MAG TPA: alpha/beta fold hydrolase [Candidatus Acidoferrales bacterium]|nr:alpha/beta fold hydrolase [Candidatus Acidoferrales bacterium]